MTILSHLAFLMLGRLNLVQLTFILITLTNRILVCLMFTGIADNLSDILSTLLTMGLSLWSILPWEIRISNRY